VKDNVFLIRLSNLPGDIERNKDLILRRNWIDLPIRFASGQRAILSFEKGVTGDQVLNDAFRQWGAGGTLKTASGVNRNLKGNKTEAGLASGQEIVSSLTPGQRAVSSTETASTSSHLSAEDEHVPKRNQSHSNVTALAKVDPTIGEPLFQTVVAKLKPGDRLEPMLRAHGMKLIKQRRFYRCFIPVKDALRISLKPERRSFCSEPAHLRPTEGT